MTTKKLLEKKGVEKIVMLTAYDSITAAFAEAAGVDMILVGDSMGNTALGYQNTLPVTFEAMCHHTSAVVRACKNTFVVFDMPFMGTCGSIPDDVRACGRALKECGCQAVKIEGGRHLVPLVRALTEQGIPVMPHLGLMPQRVHQYGGMFVQGKTEEAAADLVATARELSAAGAFAFVVECVPEELGKKVSAAVPVPVIGIGAGRYTDGQVQVLADLLGLMPGKSPKHAKRYAEIHEVAVEAIGRYVADVRGGVFPGTDNVFGEK